MCIRPEAAHRSPEGILTFLTGSLLEPEGKEYALEMADDALRLTRSTLPDETLSVLWLAATRARFDPQAHRIPIRAWLERIAETCLPCTGKEQLPEPGTHDEDLRPDLQPAVLAELEGIADALADKAVTSSYAPPLPTLVPALQAAVPALGADLAFRLFLRAMKAYFVPIGPARMARLDAIGARLGYHEFVVDDGGLNIWPDLND